MTAHNIEFQLRNSVPDTGILRREEIPITRWAAANSDSTSTSSTPTRALLNSRVAVLRWAATAGAASPILLNIDVPNDFWEGTPGVTSGEKAPVFKLRVTARKRQPTGTTDENATLKLKLAVAIDRGAASTTNLSSDMTTDNLNAITATVAATDTGTDFTTYTFNIAAALTAQSSSLQIKRGDKVYLALYPSATVGSGSNTMVLEMKRAEIEWRRHVAAFDSTLR